MAQIVQQGQHKPAYVTKFVADTMESLAKENPEKYMAGSEAYVIANQNTYILGEDHQWHKKTTTSGGSGGGNSGIDGEDGATFTPNVSVDGVLSWTNDKLLPNPTPVNIKGKDGVTPHIDSTTKNWIIGTTDTGVNAAGGEYLIFKAHTAFPNRGKVGVLYIATDENAIYRWSEEQSIYTLIASSSEQAVFDAFEENEVILNIVF